MYARCTIIQSEPQMVDQAVKIITEQVLPQARELDGFKGILSFVDPDSGKGMTFTLWESAEARHASVEAANQLRSNAADQLRGSVVAVENYELVVDEH